MDNYYMSEENPYMKVDEIQNPETYLQRIIRQSRGSGQAFGSFAPSTGQEGLDLAKVIGRQFPGTREQSINPFQQGAIGMGANIAGLEKSSPLIPEPETEFGKNLEFASDIAPYAIGGIKALEKSPKAIKGIYELFSQSAQKRKLSDVARRGAGEVEQRFRNLWDEFHTKFGEGLNKMKPKVTNQDFADSLRKAANDPELGTKNIPGSGAEYMEKLAKEFESLSTSRFDRLYTGRELHKNVKDIQSKLDDVESAIFRKHLLEKLPKEYNALREAHKPIYDLAKKKKLLSKGKLKSIGLGNVGEEEVSDLRKVEESFGMLNVIKKSIRAGKKVGRAGVLKELAKLVGYGAGATAIGGGLLNKFNQ